jgi:hypothetical protein
MYGVIIFAQILWYNKSRTTGRICPACQRLYRIGDALPDHLDEEHRRCFKKPHPRLAREQEISGLCVSFWICFLLSPILTFMQVPLYALSWRRSTILVQLNQHGDG